MASADHERAARQFGPVMSLGAEDIVTKAVTKRQAQRSRHRHVASAEKTNAGSSAAPIVGAAKPDYQVGIPGQSMEPLISSCTKPARSCLLGLLCGC